MTSILSQLSLTILSLMFVPAKLRDRTLIKNKKIKVFTKKSSYFGCLFQIDKNTYFFWSNTFSHVSCNSCFSMEGVIVNFRRGRHHQTDNQMVIQVEGISDKEKAQELVGKKVVWTSPAGKEITGKISAVHGNSGAVRAIFEKGMPGQAIGSKVKIE